jgi:hypothetical protein
VTDTTQTPDELFIILGGENHRMFMSFALLHELTVVVPDLPDVTNMGLEVESRAKVFGVLFAKRDADNMIIEPAVMSRLKLSVADAQKIMSWVQSHLFGFFLGALEGATQAATPYEARMKAALTPPTPSGGGSPG